VLLMMSSESQTSEVESLCFCIVEVSKTTVAASGDICPTNLDSVSEVYQRGLSVLVYNSKGNDDLYAFKVLSCAPNCH